jgi:hypothetical protein
MQTTLNWKALVTEAFRAAPEPANTRGRCGLLCLYQYIYQALNRAGIGNRSPFGVTTLLAIWWRSLHDRTPLNQQLVEAVEHMQRPARGFYPNGQWAAILALVLPLSALVPHCASTFSVKSQTDSILRFVPTVSADIDQQEIHWPATSDYLIAANQFLEHPVLYNRKQGVYDASWIATQPDDHYALQVLSTTSLDSLLEFCKKHQICTQSAYQQAQVKRKQVFRLFYGSYPDRQSANLARTSLPEALQKLKPWPRLFAHIRQTPSG